MSKDIGKGKVNMPFIGPWEIIILAGPVIILILAAGWFWGRRQQQQTVAIPAPSQKVMVRCPTCKSLNEEEATFCSNCGSRMK